MVTRALSVEAAQPERSSRSSCQPHQTENLVQIVSVAGFCIGVTLDSQETRPPCKMHSS